MKDCGNVSYIVSLSGDVVTEDVVGQKAATLAKLKGFGLPVPDGFIITTAAYRRFSKIAWLDRASTSGDFIGDDIQKLATVDSERTKQEMGRFPSIPGDIIEEIKNEYSALRSKFGSCCFIARSSATLEGALETSFSGQFTSISGISSFAKLVDAIICCFVSPWRPSIRPYFQKVGKSPTDLEMAVLVQREVNCVCSGALATHNPLSKTGTLIIESHRHSEAVTGASHIPDVFIVTRDCRVLTTAHSTAILSSSVSNTSTPSLSVEEILELGRLGLLVETLLGTPQLIEWAKSEHGFQILQSRPLLLTDRSSAPKNAEQKSGEEPGRLFWRFNDFSLSAMHLSIVRHTYGRDYNFRLAQDGILYFSPKPAQDSQLSFALRYLETLGLILILQILPLPRADKLLSDKRKSGQSISSLFSQLHAQCKATTFWRNVHSALSRPGPWHIFLNEFGMLLTGDSEEMILELFDDAQVEALARDRQVGLLSITLKATNSKEEVNQILGALLESHGYWPCFADDVAQPRWTEKPDFVQDIMTRVTDAGRTAVDNVISQRTSRKEAALARCLGKVRAESNSLSRYKQEARFWLSWVLHSLWQRAHRRCESANRRNWANLRWLLLTIGDRLAKSGALNTRDDIFLLDICKLLRFAPTGLGKATPGSFDASDFLSCENELVDSLAQPPAAMRASLEDFMYGIPCSAGRAKGRAKVVRSADDLLSINKGDILVGGGERAYSLVTFFPLLSGIILVTGGVTSHLAGVAREFEIPMVASVTNATEVLQTGDIVYIDGTSGWVFYTRNPDSDQTQQGEEI